MILLMEFLKKWLIRIAGSFTHKRYRGFNSLQIDGSEIIIEAATICVHSDTPNAPAIAMAVSQAIGNIH